MTKRTLKFQIEISKFAYLQKAKVIIMKWSKITKGETTIERTPRFQSLRN